MPPGGSVPDAAAGGHPGPPNVLYVVFEDASIATWDAFGGLIDMPNMKLSARLVQHYEAAGARAIYAAGWKAIAGHGQSPARRNGAAGAWELYHVAEDRAEIHDVSASCPAKAAELASLWDAAAAGRSAGSPPGVPARLHRAAAGSGRSASLRPRTGPAAARR
jgi:arylsulfatase A-like enzyme